MLSLNLVPAVEPDLHFFLVNAIKWNLTGKSLIPDFARTRLGCPGSFLHHTAACVPSASPVTEYSTGHWESQVVIQGLSLAAGSWAAWWAGPVPSCLHPRDLDSEEPPTPGGWKWGGGEEITAKGFPGDSAVKNQPASAGDMSLIPDLGRFCVPQSNEACVPPLLSLGATATESTCWSYWSPCVVEPMPHQGSHSDEKSLHCSEEQSPALWN